MTNLIEVDPNTEMIIGRNTIPSPGPIHQRRVVHILLLRTKRSLLPTRIGELVPMIVNLKQVHHSRKNLIGRDLEEERNDKKFEKKKKGNILADEPVAKPLSLSCSLCVC